MANQCTFCNERHIPTNTLVLNGGEFWCEFCERCAGEQVLSNENGEPWTVAQLWAKVSADNEGWLYTRTEIEVLLAERLQREQDTRISMQESFEDFNEDAWWQWEEERQAWIEADTIERAQLAVDHWDNHEYRCLTSQNRFRPRHEFKHHVPRYLVA